MDIKQAPSTGTTTKLKANHNKTILKLKAPYHRRCLQALMLSPVERTDLDRAIGTTSAPEFVKQLRLKGLSIYRLSYMTKQRGKGYSPTKDYYSTSRLIAR